MRKRPIDFVTKFANHLALILAGVALWSHATRAQAALEAIVLTGVASPDGNGQLFSVRAPVLNDVGQMSFMAGLIGTAGGSSSNDRNGLFRRDANGTLTPIARGTQPAPGGGGVITSFGETSWLNNDGDVAFFQQGNVTGIFRGSPLVKLARQGTGETAPGGNGYFSSIRMGGMNAAGQASFQAFLSNTTPTTSNRGVYRGDGTTTVEIARIGGPGPGGTGTFGLVNLLTKINEAGQVAFTGGINIPHGLTGVFRGDGSVTTSIALAARPAAMGGGTSGIYSGFTDQPVSINDSGQVTYTAQTSGTPSGYTSGLFRGDGVSSAMIVRSSLAAPNGSGGATGSFTSWSRPVINSSGAVAFWAQLQGTPGGSADDSGLFVGDGTTLRQVVRENDLAPDGNGRLQLFGRNSVFNDLGQTAFFASHAGAAPGTFGAIYLHDVEAGLRTIARVGQPLLGSTIQTLMLAGSNLDIPISDQQTSGLNNLGQVAFQFRLATGVEGVAIWSPPTSDFNDDGDIDGEDLAILSGNFGSTPTVQPDGDATGDGIVDGADFLRWQREVIDGATGGITAVPEPSGLAIGAAMAAVLSTRRRRVGK